MVSMVMMLARVSVVLFEVRGVGLSVVGQHAEANKEVGEYHR